jgi:hypothetical protein
MVLVYMVVQYCHMNDVHLIPPNHYHYYEHHEENFLGVKEFRHLLCAVWDVDPCFLNRSIYHYQVIYLLHVFYQYQCFDNEPYEDLVEIDYLNKI